MRILGFTMLAVLSASLPAAAQIGGYGARGGQGVYPGYVQPQGTYGYGAQNGYGLGYGGQGPSGAGLPGAVSGTAQQPATAAGRWIQSGAPAVTAPPVAGADPVKKIKGAQKPSSDGTEARAATPVRSGPTVGDTVFGRGVAVDGTSFSVDGTMLHARGVRSPVLGWMCRGKISTWPCGEKARESLQGFLSAPVRCTVSDSSGAAECSVARDDLSRLVVLSGYGIPDLPTGDLSGAEAEARAAGRGIWNTVAR